ncbi:methionyl-tRNA formyltransferase [Clostridium sp. CAG:571]|nr:methionyl-tRNA formyltransferase [Clostridium sp. CAG:571]
MLNIVFMGTPDFAKESLKCLYEKKYNIVGVVTNQDKPKGRGMKMMFSPVKEFALEKNLKIYQPTKVRNNPEFIEEMKKLNPDVICVVAYGKILPEELLEIPKYGCINVHGSLLPKYRGAAPIQWAVINGEKVTGVTTMYMDKGMDTGDILLKQEVAIGNDETTGELWDRLSILGGKLLVETLEKIEKSSITRQKQGSDFSLAPMLSKEIGKIDWKNKEAVEIKNLVRGLNPIIGAYTYIENKKIKFWKVDVLTKQELLEKYESLKECKQKLDDITYGTVILSDPKNGLIIKAKNGYVNVLEIQGENAKKMNINDFLRGNSIDIGTVLQ